MSANPKKILFSEKMSIILFWLSMLHLIIWVRSSKVEYKATRKKKFFFLVDIRPAFPVVAFDLLDDFDG